ncbi:hypothetical protein M2459_001130 [Parabacteroides sp. PF5-5]|uniref:DUF6493 family protein n=1 Tax=unclassified Parabacteroides TaxID=2649774 RepID=UPI0024739C8C|nr:MULTISPECIES: DUF6493 family protein [unclassified Parabacteroides]MDH6304397.1 hypothetical protein [Parabacteroides sp. PH5-39]MDH6315450.1 hypothetical protein [Parabacteroides sp. PF5-13]MDH6319056.1 hypothetical protein [Parabacteroides sp. PH5-13]MDH6322786.1 hypothetical protein [Parabacteroides sp. PH5-8]MDH6326642.1 hypothetical protein [Parabacteroides sp. PH5-41]
MKIVEKYNEIAEKRDLPAIVPFLKSLSAEEREILRSEVIKSHKKNKVYRLNSYTPYMDVQMFVHFFCFHKEDNDFLRMMWRDLPKLEEMEALLAEEIPEHFPGLFGAFLINQCLNKNLYGESAVSYENTMRWLRKGYLVDIEAYIAMRMDEIFPRQPKEEIDDPEKYIADRLSEYPEILEQQIYYLFRYPNEVSYSDKLGKIKVGKTGPWTYILKTQTLNGSLDRMSILSECLNSLARPYKKDQLNWFVDLFEGMEPTNKELLLLQDDLFTALSLPLTKASGMVLSLFKGIAADTDFRKDNFLSQAQFLTASDTKAIATAAIAVLEKLAANDKHIHEAICTAVAPAFLSKEESVRTRAAKLVTRLGGSLPEESDQPTVEEEEKAFVPLRRLTEEGRIRPAESIEEMIFALSEAFARFDPANFYLVPDSLHRLRSEMNEEVVVKMGPAIQSAYKLITSFNPERSYHQKLTAFLLLKYCQHLFETLPEGGKELKKLRDTYSTQWIYIDRWWDEPEATGNTYLAHEGFRRLTLYHLRKLTTADSLPILSTPTHRPWLDPAVLITRLKAYIETSTEPDTMDLQQAIQLCPLEEGKECLPVIEKELFGEYRSLLVWLFDEKASLPAERLHKEWWLAAAIIRPDRDIPQQMLEGLDPILIPYLRNRFVCEPYIYEMVSHIDKDPQTGEDIPVVRRTSSLRFDKEFLKPDTMKDLDLFIDYSYLGYPWAASFFGNIKQIMLSSPNNWQTYLMKLAKETIQYASDTIGKHMIVVLELYRQVMPQAGEMDYMYLCLCFLQKDKTLRVYLGDVWAELSEARCIDNAKLGEVLGRFVEIEYAPLKRVTDTLQDHMIRRSPYLNKELSILIDACLYRIGKQPVGGLKKLLSIRKVIS